MLDFLNDYRDRNGYAPSQQEIAKHFGYRSLGTVQNYLVRLERQGSLRKTWNARRGMETVRAAVPLPISKSVHSLPLLGHVAAGRPIEAIDAVDGGWENIDVPASMVRKPEKTYVLRVTGDSMIEEGILQGDYVVIEKQDGAKNGQTVVALIGNEATIKKYYRKGHVIELRPANPNYSPIIVDSLVETREFKIEGVLVGIIRQIAS